VTFVSRYDTWLKIIFAITNLMMLGSLALLLYDGKLSSILVAIATALILAMTVWMQLATWYRIDGDKLFVRCGPLHWTIPIASITNMELTDDPTSGPTLSLRRIRVEFTRADGKRDQILISPEDREGFMRALQERNARIVSA
jgi:Bacterial PH domain